MYGGVRIRDLTCLLHRPDSVGQRTHSSKSRQPAVIVLFSVYSSKCALSGIGTTEAFIHPSRCKIPTRSTSQRPILTTSMPSFLLILLLQIYQIYTDRLKNTSDNNHPDSDDQNCLKCFHEAPHAPAESPSLP